MSTIKDDNFDYQAYVKQNAPDATGIQRGTAGRKRRLEDAILQSTIRIDDDILEQFQQLVSQNHDYERLINQALREWLSAKGVKEFLREELQNIVHQTLSKPAIETELQKNKPKRKKTIKTKKNIASK